MKENVSENILPTSKKGLVVPCGPPHRGGIWLPSDCRSAPQAVGMCRGPCLQAGWAELSGRACPGGACVPWTSDFPVGWGACRGSLQGAGHQSPPASPLTPPCSLGAVTLQLAQSLGTGCAGSPSPPCSYVLWPHPLSCPDPRHLSPRPPVAFPS